MYFCITLLKDPDVSIRFKPTCNTCSFDYYYSCKERKKVCSFLVKTVKCCFYDIVLSYRDNYTDVIICESFALTDNFK